MQQNITYGSKKRAIPVKRSIMYVKYLNINLLSYMML